jgi:dolichol-phosphate mannosyltransferase
VGRQRLDVICPVYREAEGIKSFHAELGGVLDRLSDQYDCHVLYVMDPSTDATEERLEEICLADPRASALVLSRRFGHQAALVAGLEHAPGDAVVMLDSDGQHPPETIVELVAAFERGADVVQAVREDAPQTGWLKRKASSGFYKLMSRVAAIDMQVGSADYRLLSRRVVDVFHHQLPERNPFIRGLTSWVGFTVAYVGFSCRDRMVGESKYSLRLLVEFAINGVTSFSKLPIRATAVLGLGMSSLSALYAVFAVGAYFVQDYIPPGWTSLLAVVAFIGGLQLLFLGIIAEYVGQIFDEVKGRPRYLVARALPHVATHPSASGTDGRAVGGPVRAPAKQRGGTRPQGDA